MVSLRYNICTDSTEIFFKLRSAGFNYHLPKLSFSPTLTVRGVSYKNDFYSLNQLLDSPKKELSIIPSLVRNVPYLNTE